MIYKTLPLLLNALQWPESDEYLQTVSTSSWLDHDLLIEYLMASKLPDFVLCPNNCHLWLQISRFPRDTFISVSCLLSIVQYLGRRRYIHNQLYKIIIGRGALNEFGRIVFQWASDQAGKCDVEDVEDSQTRRAEQASSQSAWNSGNYINKDIGM